MSKITMYPTRVEQPNRDKSSGLNKKFFYPVQRNGKLYYAANRSNQKDPKYHHEWSNAEEIMYGKTIQCGRKSTHFCSHKTYYGIKGYRNTCPIAGVNGTYTQPATLRLFFDINQKGISSAAKINEVSLSFEHRCTGVDVGSGKEYVNWGPNFSGFNHYPNNKPLKIRFAGQEKTSDKNPPLSWNFSNTGNFVFKNVTYKDLTEGYIDIIYGNNLETNPGNIYIRNLQVNIDYEDGTPYIEGTQDKQLLYLSDEEVCRTSIKFNLEAGYKQGNTKISCEKSPDPKNLNRLITHQKLPENTQITYSQPTSDDCKNITATLTDNSMTEGIKEITFYIEGKEDKNITFKYEAIKKAKPNIIIPTKIERNTQSENIISIIAKDGCTSKIVAYDNSISSNTKYTFTDFNLDNKDNIIKQNDINDFYTFLSQLSCGWHTIFFQRGEEDPSDFISRKIQILPNNHQFEFIKDEQKINTFETDQNKQVSEKIKIKYLGNNKLLNNPSFIIINSTHGVEQGNEMTSDVIGEISWNNVNKEGDELEIDVGTYYPGDYTITIQDSNIECAKNPTVLSVSIKPNHKQHFDEIFVRGEDSTSFDYDYLVAWEGDSITSPVYVETVNISSSYNDIKICADNNTKNITGLTELKAIDFYVKNESENDIKNLFLELNPLEMNDDDLYKSAPQEWLNTDGIFYNFKENFDEYNSDYKGIVSIKNLTVDDDNVDEEDVYIHINTLPANSTIKLKIPYGCSVEKNIYLQILLFGEPMVIYDTINCTDSSRKFDLIPFTVYDSVLTDMNITGEFDILSTSPPENCPKECFDIKDIKYTIKNIDSSSLGVKPKTLIQNDPRLKPYELKYHDAYFKLSGDNPAEMIENSIVFSITVTNNNDVNVTNVKVRNIMSNSINEFEAKIDGITDNNNKFRIDDPENNPWYTWVIGPLAANGGSKTLDLIIKIDPNDSENSLLGERIRVTSNGEGNVDLSKSIQNISESLNIQYGNNTKPVIMSGERVDIYLKFEKHEEIHLHQYTNYKGETTFYINIPKTVGGKFTIAELLEYMSIEFAGNLSYQGAKKIGQSYNGSTRILKDYKTNNYVDINVAENNIKYNAGQTIPLKVTLTGQIQYVQNDIIFHPNIENPGDEDELIISYEACNLKNNEGILKTIFKTDTYQLIPNEISKNIYCGVNTDIELDTKLTKIIVENRTINRLYLSLNNKKRENKDVAVVIKEKEHIEKYDVLDYKFDNGTLMVDDEEIIWNIGYIKEDTIIRGYIDFKAKEVGHSQLQTEVTDFIDNMDTEIVFGEDSYKCECRKTKENI